MKSLLLRKRNLRSEEIVNLKQLKVLSLSQHQSKAKRISNSKKMKMLQMIGRTLMLTKLPQKLLQSRLCLQQQLEKLFMLRKKKRMNWILLSALKPAKLLQRYRKRSRRQSNNKRKRRVMSSHRLKKLNHLSLKRPERSCQRNARLSRTLVKKRFSRANNPKST